VKIPAYNNRFMSNQGNMTLRGTKEQNKTPAPDLKEMKIYKLPDKNQNN
jgi:hypothetical protein